MNAAAVPGLFLTGDWVGHEGFLADASTASARQAAHLACRWRAAIEARASKAGARMAGA